MAGNLTFERVKMAGVSAWHESHRVYADDMLLRVVARVDFGSDASTRCHTPMDLRPSSLRGTGHHLDNGSARCSRGL